MSDTNKTHTYFSDWYAREYVGSEAKKHKYQSTNVTELMQLAWNAARAQPERVALSDAEILKTGNEYAKESGWMDFEKNDFVSCVRAILSAQADATPRKTGNPVMATRDDWHQASLASTISDAISVVTGRKDITGNGISLTAQLIDSIAAVKRDDVAGRGATWLDDLGKAIERAARELPEGADLHIELECGAGLARLYMPPQGDDDSGEVRHDWDGDTFADQINSAIDYAIAASTKEAR